MQKHFLEMKFAYLYVLMYSTSTNSGKKNSLHITLKISAYSIISQRSSLELASWSQKAGSSPQNLWSILYDIGASQVATQLRQFKNV